MRPSEASAERMRWWRWLLALMIAVGGLLYHGLALPARPSIDLQAAQNLAVASDIALAGRFTDGLMAGAPDPADRPPGMVAAPLYPGFLALVGWFDPRHTALGACVSGHPDRDFGDCTGDTGLLVPVQLALAAATLLLLWRSIMVVTASRVAAWAGLVFASYGCSEYAVVAHQVTPLALALPLYAATGLCLVETVRRHSLIWGMGAGILFGLLLLDCPVDLTLVCLLAFAGYWRMASVSFRRVPARWIGEQWLLAAGFAVLVVSPWAVRNVVEFGIPQLVRGLDGDSVSRRIAYSDIGPAEYAAGWVDALPELGPGLAAEFFPPETLQRYQPGFVPEGAEPLAVQAAAGGLDHQTAYFVRWGVLPRLLGYVATVPLIAWRSFLQGGGTALLAVPLLAWLMVRAAWRRHVRVLVLALPPIAALLLQASVSLDPADGHLMLIPALACAAGTAAGTLAAMGRRLFGDVVRRVRA